MNAYTRHIAALERYVNDRIHPGGWLYMLLCNDLIGVFNYGDEESMAALPALMRYAYTKLPGECWRSPEKVDAWLAGEDEEDEIYGVGA